MTATSRQGRSRFSVARFLIALIVMFVTRPLFEDSPAGDLIEVIVGTLVLLAAVMAVGGKHTTLVAGACLVVPAILGAWIDHLRPGAFSGYLRALTALVFVAFVWWQLFRFVMKSPTVTTEVLCAGVANFLLLALFWSTIDTIVEQALPGSFQFTMAVDKQRSLTGFVALYFALGTMTTVSFGDIMPVSNLARMLTMLQCLSGMFYMAIMIARLVALYTTEDVVAEENPRRPVESDSS
jgi:hypothetical protein